MPTLSLPHMQDVTRLYIAFHKTKGTAALRKPLCFMELMATPEQLGFLLPLHYTLVVRLFHRTLAFFLVLLLLPAIVRETKGFCRVIMQGNRPSVPYATKHFLNLDR